MSDGMSSNNNGSSLQQPDMSLIPEITLPSFTSPLYNPHSKPTGFIKGNSGQSASSKQVMGGHSMVENSRVLLHWAQSVSFVTIFMDHTLQPVSPNIHLLLDWSVTHKNHPLHQFDHTITGSEPLSAHPSSTIVYPHNPRHSTNSYHFPLISPQTIIHRALCPIFALRF